MIIILIIIILTDIISEPISRNKSKDSLRELHLHD